MNPATPRDVIVIVVVMGDEVRVLCSDDTTIAGLRPLALEAARISGRPEDEFEPRDMAGRCLSLTSTVADLGRWPTVFLSLAVGIGGST